MNGNVCVFSVCAAVPANTLCVECIVGDVLFEHDRTVCSLVTWRNDAYLYQLSNGGEFI